MDTCTAHRSLNPTVRAGVRTPGATDHDRLFPSWDLSDRHLADLGWSRSRAMSWTPNRCDPWAGTDFDIGASFAAMVPTCTAADAASTPGLDLAA